MPRSSVESDATRSPPKQPATRRILAAARGLIARGGAAEISMGDVAAEAGVSKALVHYHFHDKDTLLQALVEQVGQETLARARQAVESETSAHVLDNYWAWLDQEIGRGDLRVLISLAEYDSERVRSASRRIAEQFRNEVSGHTSRIFTHLGLTPRIPPAMIGDTVVTFVQGLSIVHALHPERDARPAFDVLWLALLTLAE
jgi:AcrR family transcriptional regulator